MNGCGSKDCYVIPKRDGTDEPCSCPAFSIGAALIQANACLSEMADEKGDLEDYLHVLDDEMEAAGIADEARNRDDCRPHAEAIRLLAEKLYDNPDSAQLDRILGSGWAITLKGGGYLEGPKWWTASAVAVGSLFPRYAETERAGSVAEVAKMLREAIDSGESFDWDEDRLRNEISNAESRLAGLKRKLGRKEKGLDILGLPKRETDGEADAGTDSEDA